MATAEAMRFDSVQLGADDPERAVSSYATLLGLAPIRLHSGAWRFQLDRGAVEIDAGPPGLRSLRFGAGEEVGRALAGSDLRGLEVRLTPVVASGDLAVGAAGRFPGRAEEPGGAEDERRSGLTVRDTFVAADCIHAIDHVVVRSSDLQSALAVWRDRLGVRLALDREFPARGLRMLFFRSGGVTLEFVGVLGSADATGGDALDGIAYQVRDLASCITRLRAAGLEVSPDREGFKGETRVATVRSGTEGVPTLLIEHVDRRDGASG